MTKKEFQDKWERLLTSMMNDFELVIKHTEKIREYEPILAFIEHIGDLYRTEWWEVVFFDGDKWRAYNGSNTFENGERVVKWKYAKECL